MRGLVTALFFFPTVMMLIAAQWVLRQFKLPGWEWLAVSYYDVLCKVLRIRVSVTGNIVKDRPVLLISNHTSWADILIIGSVAPVAFVSKKEVGDWPFVGAVAKLQRTVFVDRERRQKTGDAIADMVSRLNDQVPVVLFAEGTSSDGNRVLPFRSALMGVVRDAATQNALKDRLMIQPMSISYTGTNGMPTGRQHRPLVAWYGDLDFVPHLRRFINRGPFDVVVSFGEPFPAEGAADRKAVTKRLEQSVRRIMVSTLRGQAPGIDGLN